MSPELGKAKITVKATKAECEALTTKVFNQKHQMEDQEKFVTSETIQLTKNAAIIQEKQAAAEFALARAQPDIDAGNDALLNIQKNINQIHEIAGYREAHGDIGAIVEALMFLLDKQASFQSAKVVMKDPSIVSTLQNFYRDNISPNRMKKLGHIMKNEDLDPKKATKLSDSCAMLAEW